MSIERKMGKSGHNAGVAGTGHDKAYAHCEAWEYAFRLWRTVPADGFGPAQRAAVAECLQRTSSTIGVWRAAIRGDAPSAIQLLLRTRPLSRITARNALGALPITKLTLEVDLAMSALTVSSLGGNAGSVLVLSHILRLAPLDHPFARELSVSWLVLNLRRALEPKATAVAPCPEVGTQHPATDRAALRMGDVS